MVYDPSSEETKAAQERANRLALMKLRERLAEGYKDAPSHFLLELAQNAYDAMAKNLRLSLVRVPGPVGDLLIVWNDGDSFKKNQFNSIIGAWSSTKVEGQAGRFGIGFKSVYFHAECADLLSGEFRYRMPRKPWDPSEEWPPDVPETDRKWGLERNLSAADWEPYQQHLPPQVRMALSNGGEIPNRLAEPQHAGKAVLWLAPGAELCEQAISAIRDLHVARSITDPVAEPRPLAFRRWYDGNNRERVIHPEGVAGTVIACTYQTLEGLDPVELERLSPSVVLGVLDEAHRSVATAWRQPIDRLMADGVPFLGLSATPDGAIQLLGQPVGVSCFGNEDPQAALVRDGVLAKPVKVEIPYDGERMPETDLPEDEEAEPRGAAEPWRGALARHPQRREAIGVWIQSHLGEREGGRVLFFGSSLGDAVGMTAWLRQRGVPAELVSGRVRGPVRRRILAKFHEGEVQVLCNFGVLTTGIDEPLITAVVIARPTCSLTLYTQMAGRGLRGPGAGGTENCLIADVLDTSHPRLAKDRWWRRQDRMV